MFSFLLPFLELIKVFFQQHYLSLLYLVYLFISKMDIPLIYFTNVYIYYIPEIWFQVLSVVTWLIVLIFSVSELQVISANLLKNLWYFLAARYACRLSEHKTPCSLLTGYSMFTTLFLKSTHYQLLKNSHLPWAVKWKIHVWKSWVYMKALIDVKWFRWEMSIDRLYCVNGNFVALSLNLRC